MATSPVLKAIPTSTGYLLEEFDLKYMPLVLDRSLDDDIALYGKLCWRFGLIMSWALLLFMGDEAEQLWLRRGGSRDRWSGFERAARAFDYEVMITAMTTRELTLEVAGLATGNPRGAPRPWAPSMPEVCFGAALMKELKRSYPDLVLTADQPLAEGSPRRTDFVLGYRNGRAETVRIEVNGFQDRFGTARTNHGVEYAARQPARLRAYAQAGLEPPIVVYADEVTSPCLLDRAVRRVIAELVQFQDEPVYTPD